MTAATHWIDAVDDLDIELLTMSDDELEAFAYEHAEPVESALPMTPRAKPVERHHAPLPHAA